MGDTHLEALANLLGPEGFDLVVQDNGKVRDGAGRIMAANTSERHALNAVAAAGLAR